MGIDNKSGSEERVRFVRRSVFIQGICCCCKMMYSTLRLLVSLYCICTVEVRTMSTTSYAQIHGSMAPIYGRAYDAHSTTLPELTILNITSPSKVNQSASSLEPSSRGSSPSALPCTHTHGHSAKILTTQCRREGRARNEEGHMWCVYTPYRLSLRSQR